MPFWFLPQAPQTLVTPVCVKQESRMVQAKEKYVKNEAWSGRTLGKQACILSQESQRGWILHEIRSEREQIKVLPHIIFFENTYRQTFFLLDMHSFLYYLVLYFCTTFLYFIFFLYILLLKSVIYKTALIL